ncbi:MAG: transcriptional regulator [Pseudomonadales bacterium]|nr:transcriptional regulator [Pseudomonadales bacterium]
MYQIKRRGPQKARDLAAYLAMTTMGIRQHLAALEAEGLVEPTPAESQGRGRPVSEWRLTEAGHKRFPDAHAEVTRDLLISVRDLFGEDAMETLIDKRTRESQNLYTQALNSRKSLRGKVDRLAELRSMEGYMAEVEEAADGSLLLIENHCPICIAAETCQGFCRSELEVFRALLAGAGATVEREDYLLTGARRCSYRISRKSGRHAADPKGKAATQ